MAFDENSRLYVVEMRDYSEQDKEHLGQVRLLEDTDGDGRFDRGTVFAKTLSWPTAIACWDGGVFVGAAPDIYYLKDTDGDGKADEQRTVFTGFSRAQRAGPAQQLSLEPRQSHSRRHQHRRRRSRRGPASPDFKPVNVNGRDFSFDPRTLDLRPKAAARSTACRSTTGDASSSAPTATIFRWSCSRTATWRAIRPWQRPRRGSSIAADGPQAEVFRTSPIEAWRIVRTRLRVTGAATGPGRRRRTSGRLLHRRDRHDDLSRRCAARGVRRASRSPATWAATSCIASGSSPTVLDSSPYRADEEKEFLSSTDNWFRPAQFANAPDGALYVIDVYREVIEHPASLPPEIKKHIDLTSGRDRGRHLSRRARRLSAAPLPRLGEATTAELVATLEHPNGWHRDTAARLLFERQDRSAVAPLEKLAAESQSCPRAACTRCMPLAGLKALAARDCCCCVSTTSIRACANTPCDCPKPLAAESARAAGQALCAWPATQICACAINLRSRWASSTTRRVSGLGRHSARKRPPGWQRQVDSPGRV